MVLSCHQNVGENHSLLTANKSFENVAKFEHFGTTVANKNGKEIKSTLNSRNLATILFSILYSSLLSKNLKIKIYKTIISSFVLYVLTGGLSE